MKSDLVFLGILLVVVCAVVAKLTTRRRPVRQSLNENSTPEINAEPDTPIGFGPRSIWIAARAGDARSLAEALGLREIQVSSWRSGLNAALAYRGDYIFVTPPIDGWVLAVGNGVPDPSAPNLLGRWRALMTAVSQRFGEAQFFASHRVSCYSAWALYCEGNERRLFAYADEPIYNFGQPLPDEEGLIANLFDPASPESQEEGYWEREDLRTPEEEDVLELAGKRSVNPLTLDEVAGPPSVGLVGKLT